MPKFTGLPCEFCKESLKESDSVVVCPECGAPYHRGCYAESGGCVHELEHSDGYVWVGQKPAGGHDFIYCPVCSAQNLSRNKYCRACGHSLAENPPAENYGGEKTGAYDGIGTSEEVPFNTPYGTISSEEDLFGVTAKEIAAYTGKSAPYFLMQYKMMKETGKKTSLNFSAFIFKGFYFLQRKMYPLAALFIAFTVLRNLPQFIYMDEFARYYLNQAFGIAVNYDINILNDVFALDRMFFYIHNAVAIVLSLFANRLYLNKTVADIKKMRLTRQPGKAGDDDYFYALAQKGGRNVNAAVLLAVGFFVATFVFVYPYVAKYMI